MVNRNLQSYVSAVAGQDSSDLSPLVGNRAFQSATDAELVRIANAQDAADAANVADENVRGTVALFVTAVRSLKAIAAKYPEASAPIADAQSALRVAMTLVRGNVPPAGPVVDATGRAPVAPPLRVGNAPAVASVGVPVAPRHA